LEIRTPKKTRDNISVREADYHLRSRSMAQPIMLGRYS